MGGEGGGGGTVGAVAAYASLTNDRRSRRCVETRLSATAVDAGVGAAVKRSALSRERHSHMRWAAAAATASAEVAAGVGTGTGRSSCTAAMGSPPAPIAAAASVPSAQESAGCRRALVTSCSDTTAALPIHHPPAQRRRKPSPGFTGRRSTGLCPLPRWVSGTASKVVASTSVVTVTARTACMCVDAARSGGYVRGGAVQRVVLMITCTRPPLRAHASSASACSAKYLRSQQSV